MVNYINKNPSQLNLIQVFFIDVDFPRGFSIKQTESKTLIYVAGQNSNNIKCYEICT